MEIGNSSPVYLQQQQLQMEKTNKLACTRCRSKRQRCDRKLGGCTRCKSTIFKCCYPERKKRRTKNELYNLKEFKNFTKPNNNSAFKAPLTLHSNVSSSPQYYYNPLPSPTYSNSTDYSQPPQSSSHYTSNNFIISSESFQNHLTSIYITRILPNYQLFKIEEITEYRNNWLFNQCITLVAYYSYYGLQINILSDQMSNSYKKIYNQLLLSSSTNLISLKLLANLSLIPLFLGDKDRFKADLIQINNFSSLLGISKKSSKLSYETNLSRTLVWDQIKKLNSLA